MSHEMVACPPPTVPLPVATLAPPALEALLVVEHDGRLYNLLLLLPMLPGRVLDELEALAPQSPQETWDLVARLWPALAEAATAGRAWMTS